MTHVLVVGAGIAGTAAALAAARAGARVTSVAAGPGATRLAGGALDQEPWERREVAAPIGPDEARVLESLDAFIAPAEGALVATLGGILRPARAIDRAILDLRELHDHDVLVASADRPSWDAEALARAWTCAPEATERRLRFVPFRVPIVRHLEERDLCDADFAALHDAPRRLEWLAGRIASQLRDAGAIPPGHAGGIPPRPPGAILLPPSLGVERARADALGARLGFPCGEPISGLAGPSGMRFERGRDRALDAASVTRMTGRVVAVTFDVAWRVRLESTDGIEPFDAVVLAVGGLVGGGLAYRPGASVLATDLPPSAGPLLRATVEGPLVLGMRGQPLGTPSSLFGGAPESHAWPFVKDALLEQGGVLVDADGRVRGAPRGLFAAGDFVADRPRTWLEALSLGARTGALAATAQGR